MITEEKKKKNAFQFSCVPHFWHIRLRCDALLLLNTFTPILLFLFAMTVLPFSSSHYKSHTIEKRNGTIQIQQALLSVS